MKLFCLVYEKNFLDCPSFVLVKQLGFSQGHFVIQNKKQTDKIRFKLINNLIIIPVEINGVDLSFLLDTGVSKPLFLIF